MDEFDLAHTWTVEEIEDKIRSNMPKGYSFEYYEGKDEFLYASFKDAEGLGVWENFSFSANLLLLNAYSWLHLRTHRVNPASPWVRRDIVHKNAPVFTNTMVFSKPQEEPEDLTPEEIAAVYEQYSK